MLAPSIRSDPRRSWRPPRGCCSRCSSPAAATPATATGSYDVRDAFAVPRRTQIVDAEGEILTEELIDEEECVVTRTHLGYIKRTRVREYEAQGRGGRGITGASSTFHPPSLNCCKKPCLSSKPANCWWRTGSVSRRSPPW